MMTCCEYAESLWLTDKEHKTPACRGWAAGLWGSHRAGVVGSGSGGVLEAPRGRWYASDWSRAYPGVAENRAGARADHVDIYDTSIPHTSELPGKIKNSWGHIIYLPVRILDYFTNLRFIIYINYNIYNIYINTISSTDLRSRGCLQDTCLPASKCGWG